jgi:hypothetical protein
MLGWQVPDHGSPSWRLRAIALPELINFDICQWANGWLPAVAAMPISADQSFLAVAERTRRSDAFARGKVMKSSSSMAS